MNCVLSLFSFKRLALIQWFISSTQSTSCWTLLSTAVYGIDMEVQLSVICVWMYPETATSDNCYDVSTVNQEKYRSKDMPCGTPQDRRWSGLHALCNADSLGAVTQEWFNQRQGKTLHTKRPLQSLNEDVMIYCVESSGELSWRQSPTVFSSPQYIWDRTVLLNPICGVNAFVNKSGPSFQWRHSSPSSTDGHAKVLVLRHLVCSR